MIHLPHKAIRLSTIVIVTLLWLAVSPSSFSQQCERGVITKEGLLKALRNPVQSRSKLTIIIEEVRKCGVDFKLNPSDEQEIRNAGEFLGKPGLDDLVAAVRSNYRIKEEINPGTTVILLADIRGEKQGEDLTQRLLRRLNEEVATYPDVRVIPLGQPILGGREEAIAKGREHNASLVLWGWLSTSDEKASVNINFEVLKSPRIYQLKSESPEFRDAVANLKNFTLQDDLTNEFTMAILAVAGLVRLDANDYQGAANRLFELLEWGIDPQVLIGSNDIFILACYAAIVAAEHDGDQAVAERLPDIISRLNNFLKESPNSSIGQLLLGHGYYLLKDYDNSIAKCQNVLKMAASSNHMFAATYLLMGIALNRGNNEQAMEYARSLIQISKRSDLPRVNHNSLGQAYVVLNDDKKALENFELSLKETTDVYSLANSFYDIANFCKNHRASPYCHLDVALTQSLSVYEKIIALNPKYVTALVRAGNIHYWRREYQAATRLYRNALQLTPQDVLIHINLGNTLSDAGDFKGAEESYLMAQKLDPKSADSYVKLAVLYRDHGELKKALDQLDQCLQLSPKFVDALFKRAYINLDLGNFEAATEDYKKLAENRPRDAEATNLMGNILYQQKEYLRAADYYTKAIDLDPQKSIDYFRNRGNAYRQAGRFKDASQDYKRALEIDPSDALTYAEIGDLYLNSGEPNKAQQNLRESLRLNPNLEEALFYQAQGYLQMRNLDAALTVYGKVINRNSKNHLAYLLRGLVYEFKKNFQAALSDYDYALTLRPDFDRGYMQRGLFLLERGERERARADFQKVKELSKDPELLQQAERELKQLSIN